MSLLRVLLCIIFPPLAVMDKGCGSILITLLLTLCGLTWAQAPVATAEEAITGLLNRIGGNGAAACRLSRRWDFS